MSIILAMCLFSFSMSISPGPVNLITLSTGVNHGLRKAMPFVSGATVGFTLLLLMTGLGIGQLAAENKELMNILGYLGAGFIGYMGYKVATADPQLDVGKNKRPTFTQGFLLQWLNPKAWIACLSGVTAFNLTDTDSQLFVFVGLYFFICYSCISSWALMGDRISQVINSRSNLRIFNRVMGTVLIIVALYLLYLQYSLMA